MLRHRTRLPYLPALDGLRAVAVIAVLLFHADVAWMRGGHLGVTVFFTLSGFLITALLLAEHEQTGTIDLKAFWARRARRLVPAMLLCFGAIAALLALSDERPRGVVGDALASVTWVANWRFVFDRRTYADLFSMPSPFQHFWSLGIEEQFYVVFPVVMLGLLAVGRSHRLRRLPVAAFLVAVAAASTAAAAALHHPDADIARAYYGTDARIAEPLVGALLALVLMRRDRLRIAQGAMRPIVHAGGLVAAVGIGYGFATLGDGDTALYQGGFLAVAVATAVLIAAAVQPGAPVGVVLRVPPLVLLGRISYGVYLFHWPVFLLLTERATGLSPAPLLAVRTAVTLVLAVASYHLVEVPLRFGRLPRRTAVVAWANAAVAGLAVVTLASGHVVAPVAASTPAASAVPAPADPTASPTTSSTVTPAHPGAPAPAPVRPRGAATTPQGQGGPEAAPPTRRPQEVPRSGPPQAPPPQFLKDPDKATVPPPPPVPAGALRVAVVGDSVGDNLGEGLRRWAASRTDVAIYNLSVHACPIGRGGLRRLGTGAPFPIADACRWWGVPSSDRRKALEAFDPDVVVVQAGINELFDRKISAWREYRSPGDPTFDSWLRSEYQKAIDLWASKGAGIVLANTPCADWRRYDWFEGDADLRTRAVNLNVYRPLVNVSHADLFERVCPMGAYRDRVEGVADGRPDGIHFSDEAATALARNWLGYIVLDSGRGARMRRAPSNSNGPQESSP